MGKVTESEFADIVSDVASGMWKVESASTFGYNATLEFRSNSGRSSVEAHLSFDADSGRCTSITCPYNANKPSQFADEVERRIDAHVLAVVPRGHYS
ncbi:MAG TPA: hypothetical protein VGX28_07990 [Frankiaceae bacterium]|jgi:hypothetical protein|nr:hypothetical protein [Frankiaceae bacterium]